MSPTQKAVKQFRKRLRKLQDKKDVSTNQLLGLMFDMYELLMISEEERIQREMHQFIESMEDKIIKVPPGVLDEVIKRDKPTKESKGQYL